MLFQKPVHQAGITVELRALSVQETRNIFEIDLIRRRVQPVIVKIQNESESAYLFSKRQVDEHYLPAAEAARAVYDNPVVVGGGLIRRGLGKVKRVILPVKKNGDERPVTNKELQVLFVREEIADSQIEPGGHLQGFVFIRPHDPPKPLRLALIHAKTQEPLIFDLPP